MFESNGSKITRDGDWEDILDTFAELGPPEGCEDRTRLGVKLCLLPPPEESFSLLPENMDWFHEWKQKGNFVGNVFKNVWKRFEKSEGKKYRNRIYDDR